VSTTLLGKSAPRVAGRAVPARRRRRIGRFSVLLALALTVALPSSVFAWSNYSFDSTAEQTMLTKINQARAAAGLAPLVWDATLASVARGRSKNQYDYNYLGHTQPDGKTVFDILASIGYCITNAGEVVAKNNYPDDQTVTVAFNGWMGSSSHKAILMGTWAKVGIGAFKGDGRNGGTDSSTYPDHYYTAVVANPCGSATPTPTPTATPKPTPTPTPKPSGTPAPTPAPTPKPTPKPTPAPTPTPTPTDSQATASAEPSIEPSPSDSPSASLDALDPVEQLGPLYWKDWWATADVGGGVPLPTPEPTPSPVPQPADGLAVVDPLPGQSLLDAIVGGIAGAYFGH
jgi:uncharacterized protein YkwD